MLSASKAQESHSAKWMQAAEEVLTLMRKDVDKQPSTSPMTVDLWVHLGYLLFSNIAHSNVIDKNGVSTVFFTCVHVFLPR